MVVVLEEVVPVEVLELRRAGWVDVGRASEVVVAPVVAIASVVSRQTRLARVSLLVHAVPARGARRRAGQVDARGGPACPRPSHGSDGAGGHKQRARGLAVVLRNEVVAPAAQLRRFS